MNLTKSYRWLQVQYLVHVEFDRAPQALPGAPVQAILVSGPASSSAKLGTPGARFASCNSPTKCRTRRRKPPACRSPVPAAPVGAAPGRDLPPLRPGRRPVRVRRLRLAPEKAPDPCPLVHGRGALVGFERGRALVGIPVGKHRASRRATAHVRQTGSHPTGNCPERGTRGRDRTQPAARRPAPDAGKRPFAHRGRVRIAPLDRSKPAVTEP